jgi:hypothetical protein
MEFFFTSYDFNEEKLYAQPAIIQIKSINLHNIFSYFYITNSLSEC